MEPRDNKRYEFLFAGLMAIFVTLVVLTNTVGVWAVRRATGIDEPPGASTR